MKVLFLVPEFPSVSQTFVLNQITGFLDQGADVFIAALQSGPQGVRHGDADRYDLARRTIYLGRSGSRLKRAADLLSSVTRLSVRRPRALSRFGRIGFATLKPPNLVTSRFTLFSSTASVLNHALDLQHFDMVLCHFGPMGLLALALRRAGLLQGQIATAFHGIDMTTFLQTMGREVYAPLFAEGDLFLPISERWRSRLVELGCPQDRIAVHHMGIDPGRFCTQSRLWRAGESLRLLTIARLIEKKGVEYGIRAVARLVAHSDLSVLYTIVGDGPLRPSLEELVHGLGVQDHVHFLGAQSQEVVAQRLQDSHLLLAPSVVATDGDEEGIPVALMEALASGLPVIATRHSGIPELIHHGENGWLVPERDAESLAEVIGQAACSAKDWPRLAASGRHTVETAFNIHRLNDTLLDRLRDAARHPVATSPAMAERF